MARISGNYFKKPIPVWVEQVRKIHERGETVVVPACVTTRWFRSGLWVQTLEGWYEVRVGDLIATGVKGEHYPIRRDIFDETYVPWGKPELA